jgi:hypothetical protein
MTGQRLLLYCPSISQNRLLLHVTIAQHCTWRHSLKKWRALGLKKAPSPQTSGLQSKVCQQPHIMCQSCNGFRAECRSATFAIWRCRILVRAEAKRSRCWGGFGKSESNRSAVQKRDVPGFVSSPPLIPPFPGSRGYLPVCVAIRPYLQLGGPLLGWSLHRAAHM